jgi:hypothetical protein
VGLSGAALGGAKNVTQCLLRSKNVSVFAENVFVFARLGARRGY